MQPKIAQNWPKLAFWRDKMAFRGPYSPTGPPHAPFRCIPVFMGLHRCLLILRSTFHGVTQKYGRKSPDCFSGLVLVNGKSCKFLKVSPTLQRRPRKGQLKHWNSRAWSGESSAASYDPMRCLLRNIINFEAFFWLKSVNFGQFWSKWGRKAI